MWQLLTTFGVSNVCIFSFNHGADIPIATNTFVHSNYTQRIIFPTLQISMFRTNAFFLFRQEV